MKKPIYFFVFLLFSAILILIFTTEKTQTNVKLDFKKSEIKSIYLKIPSRKNDSIKLNTIQKNYFIDVWPNKSFAGYWKAFPEYQVIINYNDGSRKKIRVNAKDRKQIENEYIYESKDYAFFELIWKNEFHPNEPNTLDKLGIKYAYFDMFKIGQRELYTGGKKIKNGKTFTTGIYIKSISKDIIEYEYTELINWKPKTVIKDVAEFKNMSEIEVKGKKINSYKFKDLENNLDIYLTKTEKINEGKVKIYRNGTQISALMYNK